ncbi:trichohyalin-like isoform X2 [Tachysurus fulvidraco]|uniref:trichohyalin-like isoform X2 n=1 Tax=Tachysurus fulvidraco TaxID=1234273 RepID=UPI001FED94B3|nr:trichohyalin-like isoform X2 [Tachysurus fulvidraco]
MATERDHVSLSSSGKPEESEKEYINCENMERQKEGERSGPRNSASRIEKEVTGLEGTNMKPDQTTNVSEESENSQSERNQQLNPEHIDTDNVEDMEQRNESQEEIMRQNLKRYKEPLTENTQTLQEKDKTLEEKEKQLSDVREELRKSNMMIEKYQTQLKDKDRQLVSVGKELETSTNKLYTLEQELQAMITVVKQQKSELAEKKQQLEEKDRLLAETRKKLEMKDETLEHKGTHLFQKKKKVKCYEVIPAKLQAPCEQFRKELKRIRKSMKMSTEDKCKAVLYYVPIVSRAGTDIEAALQKLNSFGDKYIALVVLHHTFDRELITPDSSRTVTRDKTIIVDCLFSEDEGLFSCRKNDEAIKKVADWLRIVKKKSEASEENKAITTGQKKNELKEGRLLQQNSTY